MALIVITLVAKLLGFGEKQAIAYYFGSGALVDAYFVALSVPMALFLLVREIVEPAYLPLYVGHLDARRRSHAGRLFVVVGAGIVALTLPLAALGWVNAQALATWLAPGFDASTLTLTASLVRIMIGGGVLLALSSLTYITLNGHRRFALPAMGDLVLKLGPIVCVVSFSSQLGVVSLAIGSVVGFAGRILVHAWGLVREKGWLSLPNAETKQDVRNIYLLMAPLVLGVAFSQVSELADNYFASQVEGGAVAARIFARKIIDLPIVLVPYTLSVVGFPYFSSLANNQDWETLYGFLGQAVRALIVVFAWLGVSAALLAEPIVSLLFERGAFDAQARILTAWPLQLYAAGLVSFAVEALLVPFYFALRDTRTPVVLGIAGVLINIALTAALIIPMGVGGVAIALTISKTLKVIALAVLLERKQASLQIAPWVWSVVRIACAAGIAALAIEGVAARLGTPTPKAALTTQVAFLAAASAAGAVAYLAALLVFGSRERRLVIDTWETLYSRVIVRGRAS